MWTLDAKSLMKTGQLQGNSKILKNIHKVKRGVHGGPWDNPQFQDGDVNNAARWTGPLYAHAHVDEEMWTGPLTSDVINEEGVINNDGLVHEQRHKRGTERKGISKKLIIAKPVHTEHFKREANHDGNVHLKRHGIIEKSHIGNTAVLKHTGQYKRGADHRNAIADEIREDELMVVVKRK